ncbi:MAG: oxidoreductase [Corynebacterium matruchotii]
MFNLFRRKRTNSSNKPARGPGETIRKADLEYLKQWANDRAMIEAFVEPETLVNEMSVVLVDVTGDFTRRNIGGPKGTLVFVVDILATVPMSPAHASAQPSQQAKKEPSSASPTAIPSSLAPTADPTK